MAADIATTLNAWSSTSSSNQPDTSDPVGPNTLAQNLQVIQSVMRAASAGDGTIASATTTDLSTVNDGDITVSGTTTITGFGTLTAGIKKILTFSGALTLTHNATSLILPGAANITTAAGDVAIMRSLGSGNWKCISFTRAASLPTTSADIQVQLATAFTTGGTGSAYTLTPTPALAANAAKVRYNATLSADPSGSPTLAVSGLTALNFKYYDSTGTKQFVTTAQAKSGMSVDIVNDGTDWVLLDPLVTSSATSKIQPITASVASNALTLTLNPTTLDFRSATLGSGTVNTRTLLAAASLVVPSTATLGTVSGQLSRLVVIAMDATSVSGNIELAVANAAYASSLDETGLISPTAIAGGSNTFGLYCTFGGRTNLPYRIVGFVESTQATAGTWATAPSTIQGIGGQALAALSSLGYGQSWQAVTRTSGTTYYNTTGKPLSINVQITGSPSVIATVTASVNGGAGFVIAHAYGVGVNAIGNGYTTIPAGASYVLTDANITARTTYELR